MSNPPRAKGPLYHTFSRNTGFSLFSVSYPALALVPYFFVRRRPVRVGSRSPLTPALPLFQTEVSALIAVVEVVIDYVYAPWCTIAAWRNLALKSAGMAFLPRFALVV